MNAMTETVKYGHPRYLIYNFEILKISIIYLPRRMQEKQSAREWSIK